MCVCACVCVHVRVCARPRPRPRTCPGLPDPAGIIPRAVAALLAAAKSETLSMSYLEIYNEKVLDLLAPKDYDLPIRENQGEMIIPNLAAVSRPCGKLRFVGVIPTRTFVPLLSLLHPRPPLCVPRPLVD